MWESHLALGVRDRRSRTPSLQRHAGVHPDRLCGVPGQRGTRLGRPVPARLACGDSCGGLPPLCSLVWEALEAETGMVANPGWLSLGRGVGRRRCGRGAGRRSVSVQGDNGGEYGWGRVRSPREFLWCRWPGSRFLGVPAGQGWPNADAPRVVDRTGANRTLAAQHRLASQGTTALVPRCRGLTQTDYNGAAAIRAISIEAGMPTCVAVTPASVHCRAASGL